MSWPSRAAQLHRCTYVRTLAEPPPPRLVLRMAVKSMHRPCARSLPRCRPVGNHKTRLPDPRLCPGLLQKPPRGAGWPSQQMFFSPLCSLPPASCAGTIHKHGCQRPHSASWHRPMDKGRLEFSAPNGRQINALTVRAAGTSESASKRCSTRGPLAARRHGCKQLLDGLERNTPNRKKTEK